MQEKKIDRKLLISKAAELFGKKGYHQTTMDDIANACRLQKSSLYHHIPSRKILLILVVERTLSSAQEQCFKIAYNNALSVQDRLNTMANNLEKFFTQTTEGLLMTNLAVEIVENIVEVQTLVKAFFMEWINALTHILTQSFSTDQAKEMAEDTVAQIQGAILLSRAYDNSNVLLKRSTERLRNLLPSSETTGK